MLLVWAKKKKEKKKERKRKEKKEQKTIALFGKSPLRMFLKGVIFWGKKKAR